MYRHIVVVTGGDAVSPELAAHVADDAFVIAADSGLASVAALGIEADLLVGDLDSVDPDDLARACAAGTRIERHPAAKDRTDLAIALDAALAASVDGGGRLTVLGGHGGRLDHHLANALLLASEAYASLDIDAYMGEARVRVVRSHATLTGRRGELVTLLPISGGVRGVRTEGLLYPLTGEDLAPGSTRGVSNELTGTTATVRVTSGVLLAILPGAIGSHVLSGRLPPPGPTPDDGS